jgi:hypothetical protein
MRFLTQKELREMFLKSWQRIEEKKEEINKINVFPVPDMDTGSNLAKTLEGIKKAMENKEFSNLSEVAVAALDGALNFAQGNAGVIYTGFLAGFLPKLDKNPVDAKKLALAFEEGRKQAWKSMLNPKEGTILDVIDATAETFKKEAEKEDNIIDILKKAIEKANEALLATREKMEIFRKANVVDAGGLGFLIILESYLEALEPAFAKASAGGGKPSEKIRRFIQTISYRYEVVFLIEDLKVREEILKEKLAKLGNSIDLIQIGNKMKVHIHTDDPEEVKNIASEAGEMIDFKVQDIAKEVTGEETGRKVSIGIVTENVASILPKVLERYQIELAEAIFDWPELEKIEGENIYQKIRGAWKSGVKTLPKTSQATPKSYFDAFKKQLERPSTRAEHGAGLVPHRNEVSGAGFDKVLCLTLSSKVSGCYNSAIQAREMLSENEKERVFILDTLNAAAGQALFVLKAIELIQGQREIEEIIEEIKNLIPQTRLYLSFEDPKGVEFIGRITKSQANWIRRMKKLRIQPIMELKDGVIGKGGMVFAKDEPEAIFKKILKESKKEMKAGKKIRVIINHADNLEGAKKLKEMLKKIGAEVSFISEGPPIVCAVTGPGTLLVGWMPI